MQIHLRDLAARCVRGLQLISALKTEGGGNAGPHMHPEPRVRILVVVCTRVFTASHRKTPDIPARNGLRLIPCSPRRPAFLPPSLRGLIRKLDTSVGVSGPHVFAVRCKQRPSSAPPRPPHPAPRP